MISVDNIYLITKTEISNIIKNYCKLIKIDIPKNNNNFFRAPLPITIEKNHLIECDLDSNNDYDSLEIINIRKNYKR